MTEKILIEQISFTTTQTNALSSGITSSKVSTYDSYANGKQNKLNQSQENAINSGIDANKVSQISTNANNISQKVVLRVWD